MGASLNSGCSSSYVVAAAKPGKTVDNGPNAWALGPVWETQKLLAPTVSRPMAAIWGVKEHMEDLSLSLSLPLSLSLKLRLSNPSINPF